jgi:hypothetical protein
MYLSRIPLATKKGGLLEDDSRAASGMKSQTEPLVETDCR